jgi:hypothetical protein
LNVQKLNQYLDRFNGVQVQIFRPQNAMQKLLSGIILQDPLHTQSYNSDWVTLVRRICDILAHFYFIVGLIDIRALSTTNSDNLVLVGVIDSQGLLVDHLSSLERQLPQVVSETRVVNQIWQNIFEGS